MKKIIIGALLLSGAMISPASAGKVTIDSFSAGWVNSTGHLSAQTGNVYSGYYEEFGTALGNCPEACKSGEYRNWFAFNLGVAELLGQRIVKASITFYKENGGYKAGSYGSNNNQEQFNLASYNQANITALTLGEQRAGQFDALVNGDSYGSYTYEKTDDMKEFTMDLTAALHNMNSDLASGNHQFALGGSLQNVNSQFSRGLFARSGRSNSAKPGSAAFLTIEYEKMSTGSGTVAAPETMALLGFGLIGFAALRRRKKST